ncbi:hypothetical protein VTN00DRAFT_4853 [Thermoascus crustaceus]|uniref:uncharacterized protein n=1 Tax=Thermoascus crustaceus TaxID=5088 RepID=UPI0037441999
MHGCTTYKYTTLGSHSAFGKYSPLVTPAQRALGLGRSSSLREGRRDDRRFSGPVERRNSYHYRVGRRSSVGSPRLSSIVSPSLGGKSSIYHKEGSQDSLNGYQAYRGPFPPGALLRVPYFEQHTLPELPGNRNPDRYRLESEAFGAICAKWRKMVVVGENRFHYVCLPILTNNGRGFSVDDPTLERNLEEFVSIFDHRMEEQQELRAQTHNKPLRTAFLRDDVAFFHPESVVQLTYPVTGQNECLSIVEGYLDEASTAEVQAHYTLWTMKNTAAYMVAMNERLKQEDAAKSRRDA